MKPNNKKSGRTPRFIEDDAPKSKKSKASKSTEPQYPEPLKVKPEVPASPGKTAKSVKINTDALPVMQHDVPEAPKAHKTVSIAESAEKKTAAEKPALSAEPRTVSIAEPTKKSQNAKKADPNVPKTVSLAEGVKAEAPAKPPKADKAAKKAVREKQAQEKKASPDKKSVQNNKDSGSTVSENTAPAKSAEASEELPAAPKKPVEKGYQAAKKRRKQEKLDAKKSEQDAKNEEKNRQKEAKRREKEAKLYKPNGKKRMRGWQKALIAVISILLTLVIAVTATFFILREIGRSKMHSNNNLEIVTPTADESGNTIVSEDKYGRLITYNGETYKYNNDMLTLTLIGVDNGNNTYQGTHMADAIYILAIDSKTGKTTVLGVSRDIMGDVDMYTDDGQFTKTGRLQLCYSYDFCSDEVTRGDNTNKSVSRLFFGLPLKDYFAINMDAIPDLNDAIGGVTVKSLMAFTSPEDGRMINEGDTVTLHGKEAEYYVQHRDIETFGSNTIRMLRQQQYIRGFISSILPAIKKDLGVIGQLYDAVSSNSESTMDVPKLTYLASTALPHLNSTDDVEFVNLKGTLTKGEYTEMHVTNEEILKTMLEIFYKPINENATPDSE